MADLSTGLAVSSFDRSAAPPAGPRPRRPTTKPAGVPLSSGEGEIVRESLPDPKRRSEKLGRRDRLRRRADFQRCYQQGRRVHGPFATLFYLGNDSGAPRLGVTATRRLGNAVLRHRLRRRVKEVFRRAPVRSRLPAVDLVVHLKPSAADAGFEELRDSLVRQLRKVERGRRPGGRERDRARSKR